MVGDAVEPSFFQPPPQPRRGRFGGGDTAALLGRWTPAELIGFARRLDPGLDDRDLADLAARLDRMPDAAFALFGLDPQDVTVLRERFAAWPRT